MRTLPARFRFFATAGLLMLALAGPGLAQMAPARHPQPMQPAATATDPAYMNGYREGYQAGAHDRANSAAFNYRKFLAYQQALDGYQANTGNQSAYQSAFRSGFQDGYTDGFDGHASSIGPAAAQATPGTRASQPAPADSANPQSAPSTAATRQAAPAPGYGPATAPRPQTPSATALTPGQRRARAIGYREGYSAGQYDADRGASDDAQRSHEYQQASAGYTAKLGNFADFQQEFRDGFVLGYRDGFHHQLYNSGIGLRPRTAAAIAPVRVPDNSLQMPAGSLIHALLDDYISTKKSKAGDTFTATVNVPVYASNGVLAIPAGSRIKGTVTRVKRGGFFAGSAQLMLRYDRIVIPGGQSYALSAITAGVGSQEAAKGARTNGEGGVGQANKKGQDARRIGVESGTGAVLGGIFGGLRGMAAGAIAGGIMGAGGVLMSRQRDIRLYSGERIELRLRTPLAVAPPNYGA